MRELTVRIRFTKHSLGNIKLRDNTGRFGFLRNSDGDSVLFLATWHQANMRFASELLGRHQDEVGKISWDIQLDAIVRRDCWHRRYYTVGQNKPRYCLHEAFFPGHIVGINCVVPATITDDDLWRLMQLAGRYKGLSPWKPGDFGFFEVVSIRPRRTPQIDTKDLNEMEDVSTVKEKIR